MWRGVCGLDLMFSIQVILVDLITLLVTVFDRIQDFLGNVRLTDAQASSNNLQFQDY